MICEHIITNINVKFNILDLIVLLYENATYIYFVVSVLQVSNITNVRPAN